MRFKILKQGGYAGGGISDAGGAMNGPLVLSSNPTAPLQAATKGYVDSALGALNGASLITGTVPVERLPAFTGDITNTVGTGVFTLANSGVTPSTYPKVTVDAKGRVTNGYLLSQNDLPALDWNRIATGKPSTMAGYGITDAIQPTGGTMTGPLLLSNAPTAPLHIATKGYVDLLVSNSTGTLTAGELVRKVTTNTPSGFLRANGGDVSKTTYSALYAVIGDTYTLAATTLQGSGAPWLNQYDFNITGTMGAFTSASSFPAATAYGSLIVTKNYAHYISGVHGKEVYSIAIDSAGALAGAWNNFTSLPDRYIHTGVVVTKNRVYVIGGTSTPIATGISTSSAAVFTAVINADGSLGAWSAGPPIPVPHTATLAWITTDRLYACDGYNNFYAPINSDGTISAWITLPAFTLPNGSNFSFSQSSVAVTKNRVFIVGTNTANIFTAPILGDGSMGAWTTTPAPVVTYDAQVLVTRNKMYLMGGYGNTTIYSAPVNADGTLGTWSSSATLPTDMVATRLFATSSRLCLIAGYNYATTSYTTSTYNASFTGGLNDYSPYYNGSIIVANGTSPTNFRLPDYSAKELPGSYTYVKY